MKRQSRAILGLTLLGLGAFTVMRVSFLRSSGAVGAVAGRQPQQGEGSRLATVRKHLNVAVPLLYLAAITAAEFLTVLDRPRLGTAAHVVILATLLVHASALPGHPHHRMLLALSLAPLIRILSLSMPLQDVDLVLWYLIVGLPLLAAALVVARTLDLSPRDLGLSLGRLPLQLLVASTGLVFGFAEYLILKPQPLIDQLTLPQVWWPALILLVATGFNEELVFRGVMQSAARPALGRGTILYVTVLFAALHVGYRSVVDVAFVFAVGLFFGLIVARTGSLLGVTLSHGITNISLYLVVPFLGIAAAAKPSAAVAAVLPTATTAPIASVAGAAYQPSAQDVTLVATAPSLQNYQQSWSANGQAPLLDTVGPALDVKQLLSGVLQRLDDFNRDNNPKDHKQRYDGHVEGAGEKALAQAIAGSCHLLGHQKGDEGQDGDNTQRCRDQGCGYGGDGGGCYSRDHVPLFLI